MTENNIAAQAGDETAALVKQLAIWRAEVARLNDLIAHASGVQAGEEPMRAAFFVWFAKHGSGQGDYKAAQDAFCAGYQVSPRATADVERDAARYRFLRQEHWSNGNFCVVRDPKKSVKLGMDCPSHELLDNAIDAFLATTKPGA